MWFVIILEPGTETCLSKGMGSAHKCKIVVPSTHRIAPSLEGATVLQSLIHQLGNNFKDQVSGAMRL